MKIIYASKKETIELSCPSYLNWIMKLIWTKLKVKTIKIKNLRKNNYIVFRDEFANLNKKDFAIIDKLSKRYTRNKHERRDKK